MTEEAAVARSPEQVESLVTDPKLVEERRGQIVRAAVKLFSEQGYYTTTIQSIARQAGISTGLIYQYFRDKDDILFLSLKLVLETYKHEIPRRLEGFEHPVDRLCMALAAYSAVIDELKEATVLAYRSTKSLRADRRALVKEEETRTNRLIEACLRACIDGGYMRKVNVQLHAYQCVMFCHAWALKHWAFRGNYSLGRYVAEGVKLLIEPFLTATGSAALASLRRRSANFTRALRRASPAPGSRSPAVRTARRASRGNAGSRSENARG
ncbi:MAG: TetR family transcriptional regulator [Betaproteobacteria bacterium]|nr:TetR family transcriptional regulator [Betaproteobacteria bacterium]